MAEFSLKVLADIRDAQKSIADFASATKKLFVTGLGIGIAVTAAKELADALAAPIAEASEAEKAFESMNVALKLSGQFSESTSASFSDLAASLQATTTFTDESVQGALTLAVNLGATAEQAKSVTKAAADLAAVTGVDLDTATQALTKSLQGQGQQLNRLIPQTRNFNEEALKSGAALDFVASRFSGAAASQAQTYSGAIAQAKNAFSDLQESIGTFITKSPIVILIIKTAGELFNQFTSFIEANRDQINKFVGQALVFLIEALSFVIKRIGEVVLAVGFMSAAFLKAFVAIQKSISFLTEATNPVIDGLVQILTVATATLVDFLKLLTFTPGVAKVFGIVGADVELMRKGLAKASDKVIELGASFKSKDIQNGFVNIATNAADAIEEGSFKTSEFLNNLGANIDSFGQKASGLVGKVQESASKAIKNAAPTEPQIDWDAIEKKFKEAFQKGVENPFKSLFEAGGLKFKQIIVDAKDAELIGAATALTKSISEGAEGARKSVVAALTTAATAFLGPVGQALGPVFDMLSQGPEKVRQMITEFITAIPKVLQNIILAIPALVIAVVNAIPVLIDGLLLAIPTIINELVNAIPILIEAIATLSPRIIDAIILNLPAIVSALAFLMPQVSIALTTALIAQAPNIALSFAQAFVLQVPRIVQAIAEGVKNSVSNLGRSIGKGGLGGAIGGIGKKFGFAQGGMIPGGFPNDSFPARLTSGEAVLSGNTVEKLEQFLASGGGGGGAGTVVVKLMLGEQELAETILNLNRQGYRLA